MQLSINVHYVSFSRSEVKGQGHVGSIVSTVSR